MKKKIRISNYVPGRSGPDFLGLLEKLRTNRYINFEFLLLVGFVLFINLPFLRNTFYPVGESRPQFWCFLTVYDQLFFNHQIPLWFPHSVMGTPGHFEMIMHLSPTNYLMLFIGELFRIRDALMLFNISMVIEQLLFLFGIYKLSGLLFKRRSAVILVCLVAAGSVIWSISLWWNFRLYYMIPMISYAVFYAFRSRKPEFFWLAGIITVLSMIGNLQYYAPVYLFVMSIIGIGLFIKDIKFLPALFKPSVRNFTALVCFVALAGLYAYLIFHIGDLMDVTAGQRDPITGKTPLINFLTYTLGEKGLNFDPFEVLTGMTTGRHNTYYIGLLPFALFLYSIFKKNKERDHKIMLAVVLLLSWLSLGGLFAIGLYRAFPLMDLFRNITLVFSLVKIFVILCAGFGFEYLVGGSALVKDLSQRLRKPRVFPYMVFGVVTGGLVFLDLIWTNFRNQLDPSRFWDKIPSYFVMLIIMYGSFLIYLLWTAKYQNDPKRIFARLVLPLLFLVVMVDLCSFQWRWALRFAFQHPRQTVAVKRIDYQPVRVNIDRFTNSADNEPRDLMYLDNYAYWFINNTKNIDPYKANALSAFTPSIIVNFLRTFSDTFPKVSELTTINTEMNKAVAKSRLVRYSLGCDQPKIRIVSDIIFARDYKDAQVYMKRFADSEKDVIIDADHLNRDQAGAKNVHATIVDTNHIRVRNFSANSIEIEAKVDERNDSYLVYSDNYHPGWKATVNGKQVPIYLANLSFKAVKLQDGTNIVKFSFFNGWYSFILVLIIIISAIFSLIAVCATLILLVPALQQEVSKIIGSLEGKHIHIKKNK